MIDKYSLGGFIVGLSLAYGFCSFVTMFVLFNSNLHDQIIYGMVPTIIIALIGTTIHVVSSIHYERQNASEVSS